MQYPEDAIDYVVVHELAHIKHHNHSKQFWSLVEKYMPDYKERKKLLKG
jgi:predicted metal-dependent hydrolase